MTLQEVSILCQVPLNVLAAALKLPGGADLQVRLSSLVGEQGIEVSTVREVVDRYQAENPLGQR